MLKTGEWLSLSIIGLVIIFILIGPAIALSFFTNVFSKDISQLSSILVITSGIILIIGMIYVIPLISQIKNIEIPIWILNVPFIFIGFGILLFSMSIINFKKSKRKRKSTFDFNE